MRLRVLGVSVAIVAAGIAVPAVAQTAAPVSVGPSHHLHWVASWTMSPTDSAMPEDAAGKLMPLTLRDESARMIVTPHLAGRVVRVHLSNRFGAAATTFGRVTVAPAHHHGIARPRPVTFGGKPAVTVAPGDDAVSDPVHLRVRAFRPLAVSMYLPGNQALATKHWNANATSYYSDAGAGDLTQQRSDASYANQTDAWWYVDGLDVRAPRHTKAIVAFGDSITDGFVAQNPISQPVSSAIADKNGRYPDDLQRRIDRAGLHLSVVNEGIGSNRLVTDGEPLMMGLSGLQRFRPDALDVAGVTGILLQEGINDFGLPPQTTTAKDLIAGYKEAIARAHAAGLTIWLGTLLPASNAIFDGVSAPGSEAKREQANAWIRTQKLADGVVDFDQALRDPSDHTVLRPKFSGPDHLHPNLRGYRVMSRTVALSMLSSVLKSRGGR
jgi:lysophospholipase L1-like esterase